MQTTPPSDARAIVLVTRPEPGAADFSARIRAAQGGAVEVIVSPVVAIEPTGDVPDLSGVATLIFTSPNGVRAFLTVSDRRDLPCYAVGDATADTARRAGMAAISAQGDARDLLHRILADGADGPFLHLRGEHAAADVAGALREAGRNARDAVLYRQVALPLTDAARAALGGTKPVVAPFFSPRSARLTFEDTRPACPLIVIAISDAVAEQVPKGAARQVLVAERPDFRSMMAELAPALAAAKRLESGGTAQ